LGDRVEATFYYSDSMIAICWTLNTLRRLHMYVHNRVQSIRHIVDRVNVYPLYHIDGNANLADWLTKPRTLKLSDFTADSSWMSGLPWMRLPTEHLPQL
jgi:hypothetical protein